MSNLKHCVKCLILNPPENPSYNLPTSYVVGAVTWDVASDKPPGPDRVPPCQGPVCPSISPLQGYTSHTSDHLYWQASLLVAVHGEGHRGECGGPLATTPSPSARQSKLGCTVLWPRTPPPKTNTSSGLSTRTTCFLALSLVYHPTPVS